MICINEHNDLEQRLLTLNSYRALHIVRLQMRYQRL